MVINTAVAGFSNIIVYQYAYTDTNWKDKMTEYNGQTITYDRIGNPLTYRDGMTMTWKRGRQLTTLQTEENSIQYKYNSDSIRTSKIVDGVVHTYEYLDGLLMHETRGEQAYDYYYDANGQLYAVSYKLSENDTKKVYYFTHDWRGDIVGIYNGNGDLKATYSYDAWGNVTAIEDANGNAITSATHIANLNPFRYRGYYQDTETGLYYLLSRYYDPVTHRFLNADGVIAGVGSIQGCNLFAYCINNPVNKVDFTGYWPKWITNAANAVSNTVKNVANSVKNTVKKVANVVSTTVKNVANSIKDKIYSVYYNATKWHFEDREEKNGKHPTYAQVRPENSGWTLLDESDSMFHMNGVGKPELKYVHYDGREAVFDGDTLLPITDPRYIATYNYIPLYTMPESGAGFSDYFNYGVSWIGHGLLDVLPYLLTGKSNTREQFEGKIFLFN